MISKAIDKLVEKLPPWGKPIFWLIFAALTIVASAYCIAHDGVFYFLLKVIFSP